MMRSICLLFVLASTGAFAADYTVSLDNVRFSDLARVVYGDILKKNYTLDTDLIDAPEAVSVSWKHLKKGQIQGLMDELSGNRGFEISERHGVVFIQSKEIKSDEEILIYLPKYRSPRYLSDIVVHVTDARPIVKREFQRFVSQPQDQGAEGQNPAPVPRSKPVQAMPDSDQVVLSVKTKDVLKVTKLLGDLDTAQGEVVLKAAVYEVGIKQGEGGALKVASRLLNGSVNVNASIGGAIVGSNTLGYVNGGLDVVLSLLDQDSRFKTISRPMVRVRSGAQARFSVGQDVPVLGQATLDKNGNPVQSVDYRQSGVILMVTPEVRDSVIDLDISQELSSFISTTTGVNNSPTLLKRTVNSKLSIKPGEVVIFAGLNESKTDQTQSRFFGFEIGNQSNQGDTEILVFVEAERI
ncbi:MAG: hypothetical protein A3H31_01610 [Gallionellales bacterium RIFCSPLOWO2_02_FULL_57_47]|nr:MAG: hypothetical protein A3H31_01610 [Gallionellales bacterium RIFCSPLOWO2_02_FULL_57_47]